MELLNATRMHAGLNVGLEPSGRQLLVVVIKGTFNLPRQGERLGLCDEQVPLVDADIFTGEPGTSAPVYESDYAPRKLRCDVLLVGSAWAPQGRPATHVPVGVRIGAWQKSFTVVGDRVWSAGVAGARASPARPFVRMPISYDVAFGGVDVRHEDPSKHAAFDRNPVGRGFHRHLKAEWLDGAPLPNTETLDRPVTRPDESYDPMAFGPLGRGWPDRLKFAGTYDQAWLDEHFPFPPPDFDERYHQAAPADQQLAFPVGGQRIVLANLTPDGLRSFDLPLLEAPVTVFPRRGDPESRNAELDTIVFEPDHDRFTLTWRLTRPLADDVSEIEQVLVGRKGSDWWGQREQVDYPLPVLAIPEKGEDS